MLQLPHRRVLLRPAIPSFVPLLDGIPADLSFGFDARAAWQLGASTSLAALVAVTRATTTAYGRSASGLCVPYGANVLRYDDVLGGALIEEGRTNLCLRSSELDNATWVKAADVSVTANTTIGIFNTTTADTLTCNGAGGGAVYQAITVTASTTYTLSFFAMLGTLAAADYKFAVYDVSNAAFIGVNLVPSTLPTTTGWTRVTYTFTTPVGCTSVRVYPLRNSTNITGTIYIDQCQLELGSFATSPIPTTSTSVARAADRLICDQADDYGPTGTMLVEWVGATTTHYAQTGVVAGLANTAAPSFNDCIYGVALAGGTNVNLAIVRSGVGQAATTNRAPLTVSPNKLCAAWQNGRAVRALNGTLDIATGGLGIPAAVQNRIVIGSASWSASTYINYVIKRVALWKTTRSDSAVQGATV